MKLNERTIAIILSDEGREVLKLAAANLPDSPAILSYIQDTDETGIWVRVRREDGEHLLLIRWEYVLTLDFPAGEAKAIGLKP